MIQGLRVRFTTAELQTHLIQSAEFWDLQADRVMRALETHGGGASERQIHVAKERIVAARRGAELHRSVAARLPLDEVFEFPVQRNMKVSEIEWPIDPGVSDEMLARAIFQEPEPLNPFAEMLRRSRPGAADDEP